MFGRLRVFSWLMTWLILTSPLAMAAQQPAVPAFPSHTEILNVPYKIISLYQGETGRTYIGLFFRELGADVQLSYYVVYEPKLAQPASTMVFEVRMTDGEKVDRPARIPLTLTADGQILPVPALTFIQKEKSHRQIIDARTSPPVKRDQAVTISTYQAVLPYSSLSTLATAKSWQMGFAEWNWTSADIWIPQGTFAVMQSVVNASSKRFASDELVPYRKNGKYGFADTRGTLVIPARYDNAWRFTEGRAAVGVSGAAGFLYGFIDTTGREVIPIQYSVVSPFLDHQGFAKVLPRGETLGWKLIDPSGAGIEAARDDFRWAAVDYNPSSGWSYWISEGMTLHSVSDVKGTKWGYWGSGGRPDIPPVYDEATGFRNGRALVSRDDDRFYIDTAGRKVQSITAPRGYKVVGNYDDPGIAPIRRDYNCSKHTYPGFSPDHYIVETECERAFGYADTTGRVVVAPTLYSAEVFSDGLGLVGVPARCKDQKKLQGCKLDYGYVDAGGRYAIAPQFVRAESFSGGMAAVVFAEVPPGSDPNVVHIGDVVFAAQTGGRAYIEKTGFGPSTVFPAPWPDWCVPSECRMELKPFWDDVGSVRFERGERSFSYFIDRAGRAYWDGGQ